MTRLKATPTFVRKLRQVVLGLMILGLSVIAATVINDGLVLGFQTSGPEGNVNAEENSSSAPLGYFDALVDELEKTWPNNRRIHLVFHGHSVPAGYFRTPAVHTMESYPHLTHVALHQSYPNATIDVSVTAIGGEESDRGAKRFADDVLSIRPDVIMIDYALNDRRLGLKAAEVAWRQMIMQALEANCRVVLLTPTADTREDLMNDQSPLAQHAAMIRQLGNEFRLPVVDSYQAFRNAVTTGTSLTDLMSAANHPNEKGHRIVAQSLASLFVRSADTLPATVDLRPQMKKWGWTQRRQGTRGTCSVFATVEAVEMAIARCQGKVEPLSMEFANWSANQVSGRTDDGDFFSNIILGIQHHGICTETQWPYQRSFAGATPEESVQKSADEFVKKWTLEFHWLKKWDRTPGLKKEDLSAIQRVLANGDPVSMGSYHSVLFVGYRNDPELPGGGEFFIADSNAKETRIDYQATMERFNDAFWVRAQRLPASTEVRR